MLSKIADPRSGTQTFTISEITVSEPDAKLFELPDGFRVVEKRVPETTTK